MRRAASGLAVVALTGALAGAGSAAGRPAEAGPTVRLAHRAPALVRGAHFAAHERVRVVLTVGERTPRIRHRRTGAYGRFSARFADVVVDRCAGVTIVATGASGDRATLRRGPPPQCPPP
jgi:hypothetical protein